jgi:hypothetical protein
MGGAVGRSSGDSGREADAESSAPSGSDVVSRQRFLGCLIAAPTAVIGAQALVQPADAQEPGNLTASSLPGSAGLFATSADANSGDVNWSPLPASLENVSAAYGAGALAGRRGENNFRPGSSGDVIGQNFLGQNGGFVYGVDASSPIPHRDYFLGRNEWAGPGDLSDTDVLFMSMNSATATLTAAVAAGATTLDLSAPLRTIYTPDVTTQSVMIGDGYATGPQEILTITAGSGTSTLTCSPCQYAHPLGALVTVQWDLGHQPTIQIMPMNTASDPDLVNFRLTVRGDLTGNQTGLGCLRLYTSSSNIGNDAFQVYDDHNNVKRFRIQSNYSVSIGATRGNIGETNGSTNSTTTVTFSSLTVKDTMIGCYISGTNIPTGAFITAVNTTSNTATLNVAATGTGSGLSFTIYVPAFNVFSVPTGPLYSNQPIFSVLSTIGMEQPGAVLNGHLVVGNNVGAGRPPAALSVYGNTYTHGNVEVYGAGGHFIVIPSGVTKFQANGATVMALGTNKLGLYGATAVAQPAAIAAPSGGSTVDKQARTAIQSILNAIGAAAGGIGITA